nr:MAG TPA: hypothetical protein [Caudoviricetes sp.]
MTRADIFDESVEATEVEANEAPVTEAPATQPTESDDKAAKQAAADAEHLPNVEAFKQVVLQAVENADSATGTVSEADKEAVAAAYREVTGGIKYKNLAKDFVDEGMRQSLADTEYIKAVSFNEINDKLRVTKAAPKSAAPKADPKEVFADRVAAISLALELIEANVPEEAADYELPSTEAAFNQAQEYIDWLNEDPETRGEAPELSPIAAAAVKIYQGKAAGKRAGTAAGTRTPFTGTRRNVGNHILSAFEDKEPGTFLTVSEIVKHRSEEYGDDAPSSGAVSARLFNGKGVEGVEATTNAEGTKGAVKL